MSALELPEAALPPEEFAAESERRYCHARARLERIEATTDCPAEALRAARRLRWLVTFDS